MKKLITIVVIAILFTSCQETPEKKIVKSKIEDTYEDIINNQKETNDEDNEEIYYVDEKWNADYISKVRKVKVKIQANICISLNAFLPVLEIEQEKISQELVDNFILKAFGEDAKLYIHNDSELVTKSDYEEIILEYNRILSQEVPNINDEYKRKEERNFYESHIKYYIELMENAPISREEILEKAMFSSDLIVEDILSQNLDPSASEEERNAWDNSLELEANRIISNNTEGICFDVKKDDDLINIYIRRSDRKYQNHFGYYSTRYENGILTRCNSNIESLEISYDDAKKIAHEYISYLGVDYMDLGITLCGNYRNEYYNYMFIFTRAINDMVETYTSNIISGNEYSEPWPYESIAIMVDDDGVSAIQWQSPMSKVTSTVTENAPLLKFEKIKEIGERQILNDGIDYKWLTQMEGGGSIKNVELVINEIKLGYMKIKSSNNSGKYNLVPVWDFFGYENICVEVNGNEYNFSSNEKDFFGNFNHSYLTINAIDGSIIDRSLGY